MRGSERRASEKKKKGEKTKLIDFLRGRHLVVLLVGRGCLDGDGHRAELVDEGLGAERGGLGGDVGLGSAREEERKRGGC